MQYKRFRKIGMWALLAMAAVGCSGSDDPVAAEFENPDNPANAPIEQIDEGSGGIAEEGEILGLVTVQSSFGFGGYIVDAESGRAAAIPGIASVQSLDRNQDVIVSGNAAYTLGSRLRDGQSFSSDFSIVKINYDTGRVSQLALVGADRESDSGPIAASYRVEAVTNEAVVVSERNFADNSTRYRVFDVESGEEGAVIESLDFSFQYDDGSCDGSVASLVGLSDGTLMGEALEWPAVIDIESGEVDLLVDCDDATPLLGDFVTVDDFSRYAVVNDREALKTRHIEELLKTELGVDAGFVEGDGDLWWLSVAPRTVET